MSHAFCPSIRSNSMTRLYAQPQLDIDGTELTSPEIVKLRKKIEELKGTIQDVQRQRKEDETLITKLDQEYGDEIARIKREFARMKERAFEEATAISNKAKVDAIKEVLPVTDNYYRAKSVYEKTATSESDFLILKTYEEIFKSFLAVLEDFGLTKVDSVGQPFDVRYMEAIMTEMSTDYARDIVSKEYQVGYKMGEISIRPSMVVVSVGPGPASQ